MDRLAAYLGKRDFTRTPEPFADIAASSDAPRYSVQKHAARRLHFDLRLEWEGALLSWAITRGPSLRPSEKRLAVRTEDHPLSYLEFEGTIPEGNYGAGTVMLWDLGHWQPEGSAAEGLRKGHLRFVLHGQRLTGGWHLIRMKGRKTGDSTRDNWLLVKDEDEAAGRKDPLTRYLRSVASRRSMREIGTGAPAGGPPQDGKLPAFRTVQLASLHDRLQEGDDWWHEVKFDGYRALVALGKGGPRIYTRNGHDWSDRFAPLAGAFDPLACRDALIDGEIVVGAGGHGFSALQDAIKAGGPFSFYAFDLLVRDGKDLIARPLYERRAALEKMFAPMPPLGPVALSPLIDTGAAGAFEVICASGGEGLIAKRRDAPYRGGRGRAWLKVKCSRRGEFVILGWQPGTSRGRAFASLLVGVHEAGALVYAGKVGTGFDEETMAGLAQRLAQMERATPAAKVPPADGQGARWVTPRLVADVAYAERTAQGRLRHAVFHGLSPTRPTHGIARDTTVSNDPQRVKIAGVSISSADRLVFPDAGVTKRALAAYYEAIAGAMLPTCANRPVSLLRLPEGMGGESFFQRHAGKGFPDALKTIEIAEIDAKRAPYMYLTSAEGLVAAAQMGTVEFHIWGARRDRLDRPDRMVFDLDPDEGLGWQDVTVAACDLRDRLRALGLASWPLVTGGKGIHVVVGLKRTAEWETVKLFSRVVATLMVREEPQRFTAEMSKARRKGRIFIDWLRNDRSATAIAPFSVRAREGAPVAVPVSWAELQTIASARAFGLNAALERGKDAVAYPAPTALTAAIISRLERHTEGQSQ